VIRMRKIAKRKNYSKPKNKVPRKRAHCTCKSLRNCLYHFSAKFKFSYINAYQEKRQKTKRKITEKRQKNQKKTAVKTFNYFGVTLTLQDQK